MKTPFLTLLTLALILQVSEGSVIIQSTSLRDYSKTLRDQALDFEDPAGSYVPPTNQERIDFAIMAGHIGAGDLNAAQTLAVGLGYEVVDFTDTDTGRNYYHLREVTVGGKVTRGWGSYFYNPNHTRNVLIQAPHILHDTHSYDVAAVSMRHSDAIGLMFNGAHRDSGGLANSDNADVADLTDSIFHIVHQTWTTGPEVQAWQIHGFSLDNHPSFPAGTDVVLSNGDGGVSEEIKNLDAAFEALSFINDAQSISHAYNTLNVNDPDNQSVNGNVDGSLFSGLGGTLNVQGIHTRSIGGTFVHIELEQSIRLDGTLQEDLDNRELAGIAIAEAIQAVPEPSTFLLSGLVAAGMLTRRSAVMARTRRP